MQDGDEDDQRGGGDQEADQPLFQVIEQFHHGKILPRRAEKRTAASVAL
jgi:hypothetical protein